MKSNQPTLGNGKICYLEIPALDVQASAIFYESVFGWQIRKRGDGATAFDDGVNEVSGAWVTNRKPHTNLGIVISIWVDDIHKAMNLVEQHGGTIVQPLGADEGELTAHFTDPAGNIFGLYQEPV